MLLGAATRVLGEIGASWKPFERQLREGTEAEARALCGADEFAAARRRGEALDLAQAVDYALDVSDPAPAMR